MIVIIVIVIDLVIKVMVVIVIIITIMTAIFIIIAENTQTDILEYVIRETTAIAKLYQFDFPAGFTFLIKSLFFTQNSLSRTGFN